MRALLPYLTLYRRHGSQLALGVVLAIITLLASIGLLTLSGEEPAPPAAGRRGWSATTPPSACYSIYGFIPSAVFFPFLPVRLPAFARPELLNRLVADVDTLDHLYLRVISPLAVTAGLCLLDPRSGLALGAGMLVILAFSPPLFYRAGKPVGEALTVLRAEYRLRLNAWLSGNAEFTLYGASERYRQQLDATEQRWQGHQRRRAKFAAADRLDVNAGAMARRRRRGRQWIVRSSHCAVRPSPHSRPLKRWVRWPARFNIWGR